MKPSPAILFSLLNHQSIQRPVSHLKSVRSSLYRQLPFFAVPQAQLAHYMTAPRPSWQYTPDEITQKVDQAIAASKSTLDSLAAIPHAQASFENVVQVYSLQSAQTNLETPLLTFLQSVSEDEAIRTASFNAEVRLDEYSNEAAMRKDFFDVLLAVERNEGSNLQAEDKRMLDKMIRKRKRNGLDLPEDKRLELLDLKKGLDKLTSEYSKHCSEASGYLLLTKEELDGLPEDVLEGFPQQQENGVTKYKMTFKTPDFVPVMEYVKNSAVRKQAWIGYEGRVPANKGLLARILVERKKVATLLGYKNWADYNLEEKMAKDAKTVNGFLSDLIEKLLPIGKKEVESLLRLRDEQRKEQGLPKDPVKLMPPWETALLSRAYVEQELGLDSNALKQYFPVAHVVPTVLQMYQELLSVQFVRNKEAPIWQKDVEAYDVSDAASNEALGTMYLDLYPRDGKYGHAAVWPLRSGSAKEDGSRILPIAAMVANLAKPSPNRPALMSHDDVVTFFHELGHALHTLCSKTKHSYFHGFEVEPDFVEAPSQCLENWCFTPKELKRMSKHVTTGEPLPDEMVKQVIASRSINSGIMYLRQLYFGSYDMKIHSFETPPSAEELRKLGTDLLLSIALRDPQGHATGESETFAHLTGGYDAGYYGYLWSLVYACDMFSVFKEDPMSAELGKRYRECILLPGGSRDAKDMLYDFLGREPNNKAFLQLVSGGSI